MVIFEESPCVGLHNEISDSVTLKPQSHHILYDFTIVRLVANRAKVRPIGNVCYDLQQRSHTAIDLYAWSVITNDWITSMTRAIVGNRATSGSDHRPMYNQSWRPATDGTIRRSLPPATDRTSNRGIMWPIVRELVVSCDREYDKSWYPNSDGSINRWVRRPIVQSIVATYDPSYDQAWHQTIWNRMLALLTMTIDPAATIFFPWPSPTNYAISRTFFIRLAHDSNIFSVAGRS